jgi:DNA polymerase-2
MTQKVTGYLLTRHWRDTDNGVELSFWGATSQGPVNVQITGQESVCFVKRSSSLTLPTRARRVQRALAHLDGTPVDAIYFAQQRDLQTFRQTTDELLESDIKPNDRYLMERFITTGFSATGTSSVINGVSTFVNPKLAPVDVKPALKALSVDIETRGSSDELFSIAGSVMFGDATQNRVFMIGSGDTINQNGYKLHFFNTERALLSAFFEWVNQEDPDLIIGWAIVNFDLNFIDRKCKSLGIDMLLGRGHERAAVLAPTTPGQPRMARLPGRAVLDGIDLLKAGFWSFSSFSLDNVAHELLGEGKLIGTNEDKVASINRLFDEDKPSLANYNIKDCQLVNDIFVKANLIDFAVERANLTGLAIDRLGGSVAALDNLYLPRLHRHGFVAPDVSSDNSGLGSPGGYVLDSLPGIYKNVLVLDFKSLYPSIIRTFKIDPMGLAQPGEDPVPGFMEANFSRTQYILPDLIESLWQARDDAKQHNNKALSQAIKIIMNSFYGVLGSSGCRFHSHQLASSITRRGHDIIMQSRDKIETLGYKIIYGDTDSLFVLLGDNHTKKSAQQIGTRLTDTLNAWWLKKLQSEFNLECHLEIEFETHYTRFLMPTVRGMPTGSKKRYAGLVLDDTNTSHLVVKGLEAVRTDWTPLARDFQKALFELIFNDQPFQDYVRQTASDLLAGEFDDQIVYRKRLRRNVEDYKKNVPPHVRAARKLRKPGRWINYVITRNGPEPAGLLTAAPDYDHYLTKQLAPAADGILKFMGTSFSQITDAQMQMF